MIKISFILNFLGNYQQLHQCIHNIKLIRDFSKEILILSNKEISNLALDDFKNKDIIILDNIDLNLPTAKNIALEMVTGDYIVYLRETDIVDNNVFDSICNCKIIPKYDIILSDFFNKQSNLCKRIAPNCKIRNTYISLLNLILSEQISNNIWGVLFKRHLWNGLHFSEKSSLADKVIFKQLFLTAENAFYLPDCLYIHLDTSHSINTPDSLSPIFSFNKLASFLCS